MRPNEAKVSLVAGTSRFPLVASRDNSPWGMTEIIVCVLFIGCIPYPRLCVRPVPWRGRGDAFKRPLQKPPLPSEVKCHPHATWRDERAFLKSPGSGSETA